MLRPHLLLPATSGRPARLNKTIGRSASMLWRHLAGVEHRDIHCGLRGGAAQTVRHGLTILGGDSGGGHTIAQVDVIGDASFIRRTFQSVHGTSGRCCSMKCWCKARTASFARSSDTIQVMRNDEVAVPAGTMPTAFNVAAPMRTLS